MCRLLVAAGGANDVNSQIEKRAMAVERVVSFNEGATVFN